jgi:hypothetical protein
MIKGSDWHYASAMQSEPAASPGLPEAEAPPGESGAEVPPADHDAPAAETEAVLDLSRLTAVLSGHGVTIACAVVILASLVWKAEFISHFYFRQDDFKIYDMARSSGLSWGFFTQGDSGHLFPGVFAVTWVLARVAFYNWPAATAVNLIFIAAASVAAWRLLRTLFGNRIEIVIPLVLYVVAAIGFENYALWIAAVESVPMQLAIFAALTAHVHFIRTGRYRHAAAAFGWLAFGLFFDEKAAVIPLVLFAVTAAYLSPDSRLFTAVRTTAVRWWRVWAGYVVLLAVYVVILLTSGLSTSSTKPVLPAAGPAGTFAWHLISQNALPGLLGGPWRWLPNGDTGFAYAAPPPLLTWLSLLVLAGLILATVATRRTSWRAWAILAGWIVLADMLPIMLGRLQFPVSAALLGTETRYVSDSAAILAIVVGLVWLPVTRAEDQARREDGPADRSRSRPARYFGRRWQIAALDLTALFVVGSVWSVQQLVDVSGGATAGAVGRAYIANAREALAQTPPGTVIVNSQVPDNIMQAVFFPGLSSTQIVLAPLSSRGKQVSWQSAPDGYYSALKIFGADGRLYPALVSGPSTTPLVSGGCSPFRHGRVVLSFPAATPAGTAYLEIGYLAGTAAAGQSVTVTYGSVSRTMVLHAGLSVDFMPVSGTATSVSIDDALPGLCVSKALAGAIQGGLGPAIPATPAAG